MKRIDTSKWKEFRVGKLFDIHPTKAYKLTNKKLLDGGNTPVVVNSSYNNGIGGFSTKEPTEKGRMITFSDTVDAYTIFYQDRDFIGYPHVQGLYPIGEYTSCWNEYSLKFFATIFRQKAINNSFDYSYKFRRDIAINLNVLLPTNDEGDPDWKYMENYMREKEQEIAASTKALKHLSETHKPKRIDTSKWTRFTLYSEYLFTVEMGNKMDRIKMSKDNPSVNFVGRGSVNNGVVDFVDIVQGIAPYQAGSMTLSLGGSVGATFIQEKDFYTSQNVCVLIPKWRMSDYCKRFISTMITCEGQRRYKAFVDELNRHIKTDFSILLPVAPSGEPDWNLMEQYMRQVEQQVKNSILALTTPTPQVQQQTSITNYGTVNIYEK